VDPLPLKSSATTDQDQPVTVQLYRASFYASIQVRLEAEFCVVDYVTVAYLERAAVEEKAYRCVGRRVEYHRPLACRISEQHGPLTGSPLDDEVPIGRVHQVAIWTVAERFDESAINFTLQTDKSPCTEQRLPQF
jgi:hypothetical protein